MIIPSFASTPGVNKAPPSFASDRPSASRKSSSSTPRGRPERGRHGLSRKLLESTASSTHFVRGIYVSRYVHRSYTLRSRHSFATGHEISERILFAAGFTYIRGAEWMQPGIAVDEAEESEATGRIRLIFRSLFFTTPYRRLSPRP